MSIDVILPAPRAHTMKAKGNVRHTWKPIPDKPVLGLIDNAKPRAGDLLLALGRVLERKGVVGSYFTVRKGSASEPIDPEQRAELLARAHLIVSGVGD
jgi:hypothetical protein